MAEKKSRNREDFAQRMHRVVGETIERSEREDAATEVFPIYSTPESRSRRISHRRERGAQGVPAPAEPQG